MFGRWKRSKTVEPYFSVSHVYDFMMDHVDYGMWAKYCASLVHPYGRIKRIVEGGCGTGSLLVELAKLGFKTAGFDRSLAMLERAEKKGCRNIWQGDLTQFSIKTQCDAFFCLYDTIQYLTWNEIRQMARHVFASLKSDGFFLFDVVTEHHVSSYWADYYETFRFQNRKVIRRTFYDREKRRLSSELVVKSPGRIHEKEVHQQHVYRLRDIERLMKKSGFRKLGRFRDFTFREGDEKSDRIHFLFRKEVP